MHGFPDFWYTWRNQMVALAPLFQVVALDLRGYNLSGKPLGREHYSMHHLVEDVQAVIQHLKRDKAIIIGHDWGGAIAWIFAIGLPTLTDRLIILNSPHPTGITRELAHNPQQQEQSAYARDFQQEGAHKRLTPESLSAWVKDLLRENATLRRSGAHPWRLCFTITNKITHVHPTRKYLCLSKCKHLFSKFTACKTRIFCLAA